jgi:thiol-disulfide isomerase/thioredoxin
MKFLLILLFCINYSFIFTQGIKFFEGNLNELKAEAHKQNKFIFIDCYTTWCGPCKWLAKNVFTNNNVGNFYNNNFINYKLDMEKGEGKEFAKKYNISAFPTLLFLDAKGNIQHRYVGSCDTVTFIAIGKQALDTLNNFGSLLKKYQQGNRNPDFLARYALTCASVYFPYDVNEYLKTQTEKDLLSEINLQILERYTPHIHSREYIFVLKNFDIFSSKYSFERIYNYLTNSMNKSLYVQMNNKDFDAEKTVKTYINQQGIDNTNFWTSAFLMEFYGYYKVKNFQEYLKHCQSFLSQSEAIQQYFQKCLVLLIENFKNKTDDENLCRQFLEILKPYQKYVDELTNPENLFSLTYISLKAKNKNYAYHLLSNAKNKITTDIQKNEYNILENKLNNLQ